MSWTLNEAVEAARAEVDAGRAICYLTGYTRERGRYVELMTTQGWNPDPFWTERQEEPAPGGAHDGLGD